MLLMLKQNSRTGRTELVESPILQAGKIIVNEDKS